MTEDLGDLVSGGPRLPKACGVDACNPCCISPEFFRNYGRATWLR
ncbi:MAG: hypothetical protein P8N50_13270 [Actinomycetota bacterium]|nr:hypothetical protein [Actinomycetota bacterium]